MLSKLLDAANQRVNVKKPVFEFVDRGSDLIVCAPHATKTFVCKQIKGADLFTGEIVDVLGQICNVSTITRGCFVPHKVMISSFVKNLRLEKNGFLDFHGMRNDRPFDLAIGTGYLEVAAYKKEIELIKNLADKYKIRVAINHPNYLGCVGLTGRLQRETASAKVLQLEWRLDFRDFFNSPKNVAEQTMPFMIDLIAALRGGFLS